MYNPKYSRTEDQDLVLELIHSYPLGLLISNSAGKMESSYLPFHLVHEDNELILIGHMARANPLWKNLSGEVLVSFQGPDRYISPTWYISEEEVPTWNYAVVQVVGDAELVQNREGIENILQKSSRFFENRNETSWQYKVPDDLQRVLEKAIVGVKIRVKNLEGKFKLSQNRSRVDFEAVVMKVSEQDAESKDLAMAKWMRKLQE